MNIKLGLVTCGELTQLFKKSESILPENVELIYSDAWFENVMDYASAMEDKGDVDVIISAGSNSVIIRDQMHIPVVDVTATEMDLLIAINEARAFSNRVGVVSYAHERFKNLKTIMRAVDVDIVERIFVNSQDLNLILEELKQMNIYDVIGGAKAVEKANEKGMRGHLVYSEDSQKKSLFQAIDMAILNKKTREQTLILKSILDYSHEGIIQVNTEGWIVGLNRSASRLIGISEEKAVNQNLTELLPNFALHRILKGRNNVINQEIMYRGMKLLCNGTPLHDNGTVIGALVTFQASGKSCREKPKLSLLESGFVARAAFEDIIGTTPELEDTKKEARLYANCDAPILITGETGTGKELFAQSIHNVGRRKDKPFVAINCAAIPASLLESELFGYEEGAFTGAKKAGKIGIFEMANEGTIFLDEIGEISAEIQGRLLRILEQGEFMKVGGDKITDVNIRILTATNKNLKEMVKNGKFRDDLYYRLNVLELHLDPLRKRRADIPVLFKKFLDENPRQWRPGETEEISGFCGVLDYDWPGNIRELKNVADKFSVLFDGRLTYQELFRKIGLSGGDNRRLNADCKVKPSSEKAEIELALKEMNGNKAEIAGKLGISRTTLWRRIKQYEISH